MLEFYASEGYKLRALRRFLERLGTRRVLAPTASRFGKGPQTIPGGPGADTPEGAKAEKGKALDVPN